MQKMLYGSVLNKQKYLLSRISKHKYYYILALPALIYFIIFRYMPMAGIIIVFKDYKMNLGMFASEWVGLKWFQMLFESPDFLLIVRNTLLISIYKIVFEFPAPILLALMLNEVRSIFFKRTVQTIVYLPHFISWIVLSGIILNVLSPSTGILPVLGIKSSPLIEPDNFRALLVISQIWKESGWGTIVYLAAISGIDQSMYEASVLDGAKRWQQIRYITLPCIMSTVAVLLILRTGQILSAGFEQVFVLYNPAVYSVGDIIDTYVYRVGITLGRYSFATAVGVFKSFVGLVLVLLTNFIVKKMGEPGLW